MTKDDDLAAQAIGLLKIAIAVIAEAADEIAVAPMSHAATSAQFREFAQAGDDISQLARACEVLQRRSESF
ncbi:MAG: hypothetical protein ACOYM5_13765 [Caulobacter sp.]